MKSSINLKLMKKKLAADIKKQATKNRRIVLIVSKIFFHYLGTKLTKENGKKIPMRSPEDTTYKESIRKIISEPVYILTRDGIQNVHFTHSNKNEFTLPQIFGWDCKLDVEKAFEQKFINGDDMEKLQVLINQILVNIYGNQEWEILSFIDNIKELAKKTNDK